MNCIKCGKRYKKTLSNCPFCNEINPKYLEGNTIAIEANKEDLSLTALIFNQIDEFNNEDKDVTKKVDNVSKKENKNKDEFGTDKDIKKRKKILILTFTTMLFIVCLLSVMFFAFRGENDNYDYIYELKVIMIDYEKNVDNSNIYNVLSYVIDDDDKINKVHDNTFAIIKEWIKEFKDKEYNGLEDFEKQKNNLKEKINYVFDINYENVKLMRFKDYEALIEDVDNYYNEGKVFYDALSYYNKKYYNEAYTLLDVIKEDELFYDKANLYKKKIINDVLSLIKKDIAKLEKNINEDNVNNLDIYSEIENIILSYNDIYGSIYLSNNGEYNKLLNEYRAKVIEYSDKV